MADTYLTSIETFRAKNAAVLRGLTTRQVVKLNDTAKEKVQGKVATKQQVVLLPTEYGIEEYRERETRIASFCEYAKFSELKGEESSISFNCISLCLVKDLRLEKANYTADIELLPEQPIEADNPVVSKLLATIQEQFKAYLKMDTSVPILARDPQCNWLRV